MGILLLRLSWVRLIFVAPASILMIGDLRAVRLRLLKRGLLRVPLQLLQLLHLLQLLKLHLLLLLLHLLLLHLLQ